MGIVGPPKNLPNIFVLTFSKQTMKIKTIIFQNTIGEIQMKKKNKIITKFHVQTIWFYYLVSVANWK